MDALHLWSPLQYRRLAESFGELLLAIGYDIPAHCRIRELLNICTGWPEIHAAGTSVTDENVAQAHSCLYDLRMLASTAILLRSNPSMWRPTFDRACMGSLEVDDESLKNVDGRNAQYELVVAASLAAAGVSVIAQEPDLICHYAGVSFAIACKRVQGSAGIVKAFKDANRQIRKSGLNGFIAVDATCAVFERLYDFDKKLTAYAPSKHNRVEADGDVTGRSFGADAIASLDETMREHLWKDADAHCFGVLWNLYIRTVSTQMGTIGTWSGTRLMPRCREIDRKIFWIRKIQSAIESSVKDDIDIVRHLAEGFQSSSPESG